MSQGTFVWYELATTNGEAAVDFYRTVVGWKTQDSGMPGVRYTIVSAGEARVGGIMAMQAEGCGPDAQPGWVGYIAVDDVDASAARVTAKGGTIRRAPDEIPGIGRFAIAADPHGAAFMLFKPAQGEAPPRPPVGTPGTVGWHELHAGDGQAAFAFYSDLFGWQKDQAMDMGPMGTYQLFKAGAEPIGGMMTKPPHMPQPFWLYYFVVEALDAAHAGVTANGGEVLHGPMEVPGGSWIIQCCDPQGVMFALVAPKR
jgi:predicted enzyme related to lactoylglutathione lyase